MFLRILPAILTFVARKMRAQQKKNKRTQRAQSATSQPRRGGSRR